MTIKFTNNAATLLSTSSLGTGDTSVAVDDGSVFPALSAGEFFYATLIRAASATTREIVKVTARSGNTLTIVRAQDNTSALTFSADDHIELRIVAATLESLKAADELTAGDAAVTLATSAGNITIDAQGNDTDIILKGTDGSSDTTFVTIDGSDAGTASFNHDVKLANDAAVLGFGAGNDVTLTHVHDTGLLLNGTMQLQFNDASQNITAPSATVLDINATDEVEINATLADVNANLDVSGTYTGGGTMTTGGNIVVPDGGNIGSASDTDAMAIASGGAVTFSQAPVFPDGSIPIADLDIDGGTDVGEALVDADLFIVDNGAGGTNRKSALSRLKTYVTGDNTLTVYKFTASAGQTTFTGSDDASTTLAYTAGNLFVTLNGITLENGTDYTASNGTSVVLTDAAELSDEVDIYVFTAFNVANVTAAGGDFSIGDDLSFTSDAAVINLGADSDVTITHVADTGIALNSMDIAGVASINGNQIGTRNLIMNGEMRVAQRGTSATGIGNGDNGYHVCDRWRVNEGGAIQAEVTMSQDSDVPAGKGFSNSLKLTVTTAESAVAADERFMIDTIIEGQDLTQLNYGTSDAGSLTLSFWIKSTKTGTYCVGFYNGSPSTDRIFTKTYTVSSSNTWEKKTLTWVGDTDSDSAFTDSSAGALWIQWWFMAGSNFTDGTLTSAWVDFDDGVWADAMVNAFDSTSNNVYLTGVQLEAGSTATEYEHRTFGDELQQCQRYFCRTYAYGTATGTATNNGSLASTSQAVSTYASAGTWRFPVEMRAAPTVTLYSTQNADTTGKVTSDTTDGTGQATMISATSVFINRASDSSGVGNNNYIKAHAVATADL